MTLPLAVDPTNPEPGFYLTVDLLRGSTSPGAAGVKGCIISPPATAGGDIGIATEIRPVFSKEDVQTAIGKGLGYYAYRSIQANDPQALIDLVACAESAGAAATQTVTFGGAPASAMTIRFWIMGWIVDISWAVGESTTEIKDKFIAAVNERAEDLFVVASSGGAAVGTLTARSKGPAGNDVRLRYKILAGSGGTVALGAGALAGGTTEPDMSTALTLIAGQEYDYILPCLSNTDAQTAGTSNMSRVEDHIDALDSGSDAKLQQAYVASTGTIAAAKTGAIGRNSAVMSHVLCVNAESLPCELAGADMGDRMRRRRREANANRVLTKLKRVRGSADPVADKPAGAEPTDAINNGVSLCSYNRQNEVIILRSVTTHSQDAGGNPDRRAFDTNEIDALYDYAKDLRAALPQEFLNPDGGQVKLAKDREEGEEELPAGVVEERDVRGFIIRRTQGFWVPKGVIDGPRFTSVVESGELKVQVNASDPTQCDIFVPARAVKILAKMGLYLAKDG
jgi:phage tail sheath gpL-like